LGTSPFLVLNGSGNHHHETVGLVEGLLRARPEELTYIQIDAHPDKTELYRWSCNCGSFVGRILETPRIAEVYLLGLYPPCLDTDGHGTIYIKNLHYYRCEYFKKLRQYTVAPTTIHETYFGFLPEDVSEAKNNPSVARVRSKSIRVPDQQQPKKGLRVEWKTLRELDLGGLPDRPVYLTVDLDVLRHYPVTDWRKAPARSPATPHGLPENQGEMELDVLVDLIARIGSARRIAGADVCGLTSELERLPEGARQASFEAVERVVRAIETCLRNPPAT
jgi:arginase family enzyme